MIETRLKTPVGGRGSAFERWGFGAFGRWALGVWKVGGEIGGGGNEHERE